MKYLTGVALLAFAWAHVGSAAAQVAAPDRPLTDPASLTSPVDRQATPIAISTLFRTAQSDSAVWSADGLSIYYNSDRSGLPAIWQVRADGSGAPRQIGPSDLKQSQISLSADGRTLYFQSDLGGRQINDIYAMPTAGGAPVNLTGTAEVDESMAMPSPDGRFIAMARRTKTQSSNNIAILDLASRQVRTLTGEKVTGVQWWPAAVSRDGRLIVASRFDWSQTVGEVWLIDSGDGTARRLTPEGVYAEAGGIAPDGAHVGVSVENAQGVLQAGVVDVASGVTTTLPQSAWEQKAGLFSPDGRAMAVIRNVDGRDEVSLYDIGKRKLEVLDLPVGMNSRSYHGPSLPRFSPDGRRLLIPHSSGAEPLDYWVLDLRNRRGQIVTDLGRMDGARPVKTQLVRYASRDGTVISAFLWMPSNLKKGENAPAVLRPHGGPTGQVTDAFDRISAALASRGYVVLAPNFRGSTGYGRAFLEANQKDLGGGDLEDVAAGARFLIDSGFVDPKRVGITGGSYGGYMTLMALTKMPDLWAAGVDMFGIVNWRSMWEHGTLANRRYQSTLIGEPDKDAAAYDRASPLNHLDRLRAPLLVLHGQNDPIVPVTEAQQVVDGLRGKGGVIEAHIYPEEGHGFVRRENQMDSIDRIITWFDRHMGAGS